MRAGHNALAFMLVGYSYRMIRLLGLDVESRYLDSHISSDLSKAESEIRLVWSAYILDSIVGSGVDSNLNWHQEAPRIHLPCPENDFVSQSPSQSSLTLDSFINSPLKARSNLRANVIYLTRLRSRVLR